MSKVSKVSVQLGTIRLPEEVADEVETAIEGISAGGVHTRAACIAAIITAGVIAMNNQLTTKENGNG